VKLDEEALRATALLEGLVVQKIVRHRSSEATIIFTDGSRLIVDCREGRSLELSVEGGNDIGE
jgi:hypothetical protein